MAAPTKKVDNNYIGDKVALRLESLPDKKVIKVLDAYGGKGVLWRAVQALTDKQIERVGIDQRSDLYAFHLHGDNLKVLKGLDLSVFDIVDLDAYGFPEKQLDIVLSKGFKGIIHLTLIQTDLCSMPLSIIRESNISDEQIKKAPGLFAKQQIAWPLLLNWLHKKGVKTFRIKEKRLRGTKRYLWFDLNDAAEHEGGCNTRAGGTSVNPS